MGRVAILRDPLFMKHSNGRWHPESPDRLRAIDQMLAVFPRRGELQELTARDASFAELARVHTESYIRSIEATRERELTVLDPDTSANRNSWAAAVRAAGGAISVTEAVLDGRASAAFAFLRPPGHHAEADRARGFCLFNNIAVAAEHALEARGLERVIVVDWDVHHGNGTMHSFYDSPRVLYMSVHQYPHYPGTGRVEEVGAGEGRGYTVNVPLPGGQDDADYLGVFRELFLPIGRQYAPQLVLVSAGFDVHRHDPLAGMDVSNRGFRRMTEILYRLAEEFCPGRLAIMLEGGYDLTALTEGVAAVLDALLDAEATGAARGGAAEKAGEGTAAASDGPTPEGEGASGETTSRVIAEVRQALAPFWRGL
jgi:acetoin utilization deacetylase AcuC-like enzyme